MLLFFVVFSVISIILGFVLYSYVEFRMTKSHSNAMRTGALPNDMSRADLQKAIDAAKGSIRRKAAIVGVAFVVLANIVFLGVNSVTSVPAAHAGVVTVFGEIQEAPLPEGISFVHPMALVHNVKVGVDVAEAQAFSAATKDAQEVTASYTTNYQVQPSQVVTLFRADPTVDYENRYIVPAMKESFTAVTAQYTMDELFLRRSEIGPKVTQLLDAKLKQFGIDVQSIQVTAFTPSAAYKEAVEAKVRAREEALTAENLTKKVSEQAKQRIITAESEAKAIQLQAAAVQVQGGDDYVKLEWIKKWNGVAPTIVTGSGGGMMINVPTPAK